MILNYYKREWVELYVDNKKTRYLINRNGDIKNSKTNRILKPNKNPKGYYMVTLSVDGNPHKTISVHKLVAETFIPYHMSNETQVNHKDGNKENNFFRNLEWVTCKDNVNHAWENGLCHTRVGSKHHNLKFDEELIHEICKMLERGWSGKMIKKELNIKNEYLISNIRRRKYHTHISKLYNF